MPRKASSRVASRNAVSESPERSNPSPLISLEERRKLKQLDSMINRAKKMLEIAQRDPYDEEVEIHLNNAEEQISNAEELLEQINDENLQHYAKRIEIAKDLLRNARVSFDRRAA